MWFISTCFAGHYYGAYMRTLNSTEDIKKLKYFDGRIPPSEDSCIYFILREDKIIYIGQTTNIKKRVSEYTNLIMFSLMINEKLLLYYTHCDKKKLRETEQFYIDKFTPALNKERRNVVDKKIIENFSKKEKPSMDEHTFVLQCLADKRDATIFFRIPKWMKDEIKQSGKSEADFIIGKLGLSMFKPYEQTKESWQKEVEGWK